MGQNTAISIVIPTKGRIETLRKSLDRLKQQTLPADRYEIIVVDNAPDYSAENVVKDISARTPVSIRYFRGPDAGVCPSRNIGVLAARAEIILMIGNDIIAEDTFLYQHLKSHEIFPSNNFAVLGLTKLYPDVLQSPFMKTWGDMPYAEIEGKTEIPCWFFITNNISFKKSFFVRCGMFSEDFRRVGFEDIELGFRLYKNGLRIVYNSDAVAYHDHLYSVEEACHQQINHGYNFGILITKLKAIGFNEYIPLLAERFGIIGHSHTWEGYIKGFIKKWLLHRTFIMHPLEKFLMNNKNPGKFSIFMYPKLFNYYANQGFLQYKNEHGKH